VRRCRALHNASRSYGQSRFYRSLIACGRIWLRCFRTDNTTAESHQRLKNKPSAMVRYIATIKFDLEGLEDFGESVKRAIAFLAEAEKMGVTIRGSYWTTGYFDGVIIFEAPDDEVVTAAMYYLAGLGFVHTTKVPVTPV
jgi:uncharacterized protein with GYD domain